MAKPKDSAERHFYRKNLAPTVGVRNPDYGFIVYLTFAFAPDDERGMPSGEDEDILAEIENVDFREFENDGLAVHVAVATHTGIKDCLFYTRAPEEFLARAEKFRNAYPQFQVGCEIAPDPGWKHYDEFP